jgi:sacsin
VVQKTGRFGLGFNTCYNVTDYPSFVTGEYVVCFDPHQNAIANAGGRHGVRGTLEAVWETSADWLMTFTPAGLAERAASHDGTIFRLPLRTPDQASHSGNWGIRQVARQPLTSQT